MNFIKILLAVTTALLLNSGCSTMQNVAVKEPRYNPIYDYSPTEKAYEIENRKKGEPISIALIKPSFPRNSQSRTLLRMDSEPYTSFIKNMGDDFEEMLIAKGFRVRGPFKSKDEMVYSDKKNTDLALLVNVDLRQEGFELLKKSPSNSLSSFFQDQNDPLFYIKGEFYHFGNIILEIVDPFTGEKFWKKSVSLDRKTILLNGANEWSDAKMAMSANPFYEDVGVYNPISRALEGYYDDALQTASRHLAFEEISIVAEEIEQMQVNNK